MLEGGGGLDWRRWILVSSLGEAAPAKAEAKEKEKEEKKGQEGQQDDEEELPRL